MPVRAILFDLDDTLLETHEAHQTALSASCARAAEHHPEWSTDELARIFTATYHRLEAELEAQRIRFGSQLLYRTRTWQETLAACGLPLQLGEELATLYLEKRRELYQLYADVPAVLDELVQQYQVVLVTNGLSDLQREKIAAVNLERWITHIVVSAEVDSYKPDPVIFQRALELVESPASEAVMVGDNLEKDVAGATGVGIRSVWMRRYPHLQPLDGIRPSAEVSDLSQLAAVLDTW